ncbi:mitogen-activated protein kinase kinase kinase 20-like [Patiria miniata]|uniref:Protein kinase domain-containing protein n=1 Tax=Patiria miniata TaxID=46514 RepID=A0A913Z8U4_PATMI|nr:mitogen-activated protein kinase kinase kinase 20-like [Patiria miniata]
MASQILPSSHGELWSLKTKLEASGAMIIEAGEFNWDSSRYLGQGTNGTVYCMTWNRKDHGDVIQVAAKKTTKVDSNEIEVLMKLKHPNIIGYYGVVFKEPSVFIVMEYAPHGSLDTFLDDRHQAGNMLPLNQVLQWCTNLALAVKYLHDKDLVHRDIKASNCLICQDGELKLCDFNDARQLATTVSTEQRGSLPWMAPEVMSEKKFSKKSDIYSLAVVFWQILTCQVPYADRQTGVQIMWCVCTKNERPSIPQGCPDEFAALMSDGWKEKWSERPDISQILKRLSSVPT